MRNRRREKEKEKIYKREKARENSPGTPRNRTKTNCHPENCGPPLPVAEEGGPEFPQPRPLWAVVKQALKGQCGKACSEESRMMTLNVLFTESFTAARFRMTGEGGGEDKILIEILREERYNKF